MQKLKENSLDFFKQRKIQDINPDSNMHVMYAMFLYTMYKTFNIKSIIKIAVIITMGFGIYSINKAIDASNQKETVNQGIILKENTDNVSKISQAKIDETVVFLDNARDKEIARLTQMYWIIKYLDKKGDLHDSVGHSINEIQKTIVNAKTHYAHRKLEMVQAYNLVQQKKYNLLKETYDEKNPLSVLVSLVNDNNMKADYVTTNSAVIIHKYMGNVENPEDLNVYLATNKEKMKQELVIFEK